MKERTMFSATSDRTPIQRLLAVSLIVLQILSPALYAGNAWAQVNRAAINPDRSVVGERPVVNVAANGVPIVQIAPPSVAGVSNNRFTDYNVGTPGAILNNSGANNQTQLGGWIAGNPMLGNSSARTILNQVTGSTPSSLNGFTEVAGNQAKVIIANPNGITCDGCGFINAPRATLTTGTPQLGADGGVLGFNVRQGQINIEGQGLVARNLDQVELISRSLRVNAEVWANRLQVVTGAAQVDYHGGDVVAQTTAQAAPPVALDVSQFGGMYANSIRLVGTENGVGVNSAGTIEALTGTLEINQAGDVRIVGGRLQAKDDLRIQSGQNITNAGATYAEGMVAIEARGALENTGTVLSAKELQVHAGSLTNSGGIAAGANTAGEVIAPHDVSIAASGNLNNSGRILTGANLSLSGNRVVLDDGTIGADNRLSIAAGATLENRNGRIFANGISLDAADRIDNTGGLIEAQSSLSVSAPRIDNTLGALRQTVVAGTADSAPLGIAIDNQGATSSTAALINDRGSIVSNAASSISAHAVSNVDGLIQAKTDLVVHGQSSIDNTRGKLLAEDALSVSTAGRFNNGGGETGSERTVSISSAGGLINNGGSIEGDAVRLETPSIDNTRGTVMQTGATDQSIQLSGVFNNAAGTFASNAHNITLEAGSVANAQGSIYHAGAGMLMATATGNLDNSQGVVLSTGQLAIGANSIFNTDGELSGSGNARVTANNVSNTGGLLAAGGDLTVQSSGALNNQGGTMQAGRDLALTAATLDNNRDVAGTAGRIIANGSGATSVSVAGNLNNIDGYIGGNGDVSLNAGRLVNANGTLFAGRDLTADIAGNLDNERGVFLSEGQLVATIGGTLANQRGVVQGARLDLQAGAIANSAGSIQQVGAGAAAITVRGALDNTEGSILGEGRSLSVAAGSIVNHTGTISHTGSDLLSIRSNEAVDNHAGEITAAGSLSIVAQELDNSSRGMIDSGSGSTLAINGTLINSNGTIVSGGGLEVGAGSLDNGTSGRIQSNSSATITVGGNVANSDGTILASNTLAIHAGGDVSNSNGIMEAGNALSIAAANVNNVYGRIVSIGDGDLTIAATNAIANNHGFIGANGSAAISADRFDNTSGAVVTTWDLAIVTDKFVNKDGTLNVGGALSLYMNDALDNRGNTLSARGGLNIRATSIDNSADANGVAGRVVVTGAEPLTLEAVGGINNTGGYIGSNGNVGLTADTVGNVGGTIYARNAIAITTAAQVNNTQGTLQADAELNARIGGALDNRQGLIQAGGMNLQAGSFDNAAGQLLQLGTGDNTVGIAGAFNNTDGILLSNGGNLAITAGSLDNSAGTISHAGDGKLSIASTGSINNNGGRILSASEIALDAQSVTNNAQNGQAGLIQSGKDTAIAVAGDFSNAGGIVISSAALSARAGGALDNRDSTLQAAGALALQGGTIDNTGGRAVSLDNSGVAVSAVNALTNDRGFIGGSGNVELSANNLTNIGGMLYAGRGMAITTAAQVNNTQGTLQADAELNARIGGALGNRQGLIQAGGMNLQAGSFDNATGQLLQLGTGDNEIVVAGTFNNAEGTLSGNGRNLAITMGSLDNSAGSISHAGDGTLDITGEGSINNNGGSILTAGVLALDAQSVTNNTQNGQTGLIQSRKAATIAVTGDVSNAGGSIVSGAALAVHAQGELTNQSGTLQSANALTLRGTNIDNTSGRAVSLDNGGIAINAIAALTNDQGTIGGNGAVAVNAGSISNVHGNITGVTNVGISAGSYAGAGGNLVTGGTLIAQIGGALDSVGGNIQAEQVSVTAGSLDNSAGKLQALGTDQFSINVDGHARNSGGFIGGNGNVVVAANSFDNTEGTAYAAQALSITTADRFDNAQGTLQAGTELNADIGGALGNQQGLMQGNSLTLHSGSLDNRTGQLLQLGTGNTLVSVTGAFSNTSGTLASNGSNLAITASSIDNSSGSISHAGDGRLDITGAGSVNNNGGRILTAGALALDAQNVINDTQGLIQSRKAATIAATGDVSNAGGSIVSGAALTVQAQGDLGNRSGALQAANALVLQGTNIDNTAGRAVSLDSSGVAINAANALTNNQGMIGGNGAVVLDAGSISNTQGNITGVANVGITAGSYSGSGGNVVAGSALNAQISGALDSIGGNIQAEQVSVTAGSLDNSTGKLQALGTNQFAVSVSGHAKNAEGFIGGNGTVLLVADSLDNTAGTVYAARSLDITTADQFDNTQGTLQAGAELNARIGGALGNRQGLIQADNLTLQTGSVDNQTGQLLQLGTGNTQVSATGTFSNTGGALASNGGNLAITAGSLDNRAGTIRHAGNGALDIASEGSVNNNGGSILTAGALVLDAQSVTNDSQNGQAGLIQSGKAATITANGELSNTGGSILSGAALAVRAQGNLGNRGGTLQAANALLLQGTNIDNTSGRAISLNNSGVGINATHSLSNNRGTIGGNGAVVLNAGSISNTQGNITGVTNVGIATGTYSGASGSVIAGETLNIVTGGALNSVSGTLQAANISVSAGSLNNNGGRLLATGTDTLAITVNGQASNNGGFIGGNDDVALNADIVDNTGGTLFAKNNLTIATQQVNNTGGTLQADARLDVAVTEQLVNRQGLMQASRFNLQAPSLDNTAGKVLQLGTSDTRLVFDGAINNAQGTIATNGANLVVAAASLDNSAGSISHAGDGALDITGEGNVNNNGGSILTAGVLALDAQSVTNNTQNGQTGLIQSRKAATLATISDFNNNGGSIVSGAALAVRAQGNLANRGGTLQAANALTLQGTNIDNTSGRAVSLDNGGVAINAGNALTNNQGTIGGNGVVALNASSISNTQGKVIGADNVDLVAATISNTGGEVLSQKRLTINTGASGFLSNTQQGVLQGERLNLIAPNLTNAGGSIIQTGASDTHLQVNGTLDNSNGTIASNGSNLTLSAQAINNNGGLIKHGGSQTLTITPPGAISNSGGTISSNGNAVVSASTITNTAQGRIEAAGTLAASASSLFNNNGGTLQSNGALTVSAPDLRNAGGAVLSNRRLTLAVTGFNNTGGAISGEEIVLPSLTRIRNAGGSMIQSGSGSFNLSVSGDIDNAGGAIAANGNVALAGSSLNNQGGSVRAANGGSLSVNTSGAINNAGGTLASGGAFSAQASSLNNQSGSITSAQRINLSIAGATDNSDGAIAASGDTQVSTASLDNRRGSLASVSGTLTLNTPSHIDNTGGRIESGRNLTLTIPGLTNNQGTIVGDNIQIDTQGRALASSGGKIAARGTLTVRSGQLTNSGGGLLQAAGALSVDTNGAALINTQSGSAGGIVGQGSVTLKSGSLDNRGGFIGGNGTIDIRTTGQIDNGAGQIIGNANVTLDAAGLDNAGGQIQGRGNVSASLGSGSLDNRGGLVRANDTLTVNAGGIDNSNTQGTDQGLEGTNVTLTASTIGNNRGAIHADSQLTLNGASLDNTQGTVSSAHTVTNNTASITNSGGTVIAAHRLRMNSGAVLGSGQYLSNGDLDFSYSGDYANTSRLVAAGNLTFHSGGTLTNSGQIGANNTLNLSAAHLNNQTGGEISAGATHIAVSGTLNNNGLIDGASITRIVAGTLNNTHQIYGGNIALQADSLSNEPGAAIASRRDLDIGANVLINRDGALMLAAGDLRIGGALSGNSATGAANSVTNRASRIEAHGNLSIATNWGLHNLNESVSSSTQVTGSQHLTEYRVRGADANLAPGSFGFNGVDHGRLVIDSALYPIATYGAAPYAQAIMTCWHDGCANTLTYSAESPIWSLFGVAPPPSMPVRPRDRWGGNYVCEDHSPDEAGCRVYQAALQQWNDEMHARASELDQKITAFNRDLDGRMVEDYYVIDFDRTTSETRVVAGTPGRILAGGNMSLTGTGTITNDVSQIIAGGNLTADINRVVNQQDENKRTTTDLGAMQLTEIVSSGIFGGHKRKWHAPATYNPAPVVTLFNGQPISAYTGSGAFGRSSGAGQLRIISVGQSAAGAANANGSAGNAQSANGTTGVNAVNAASGNANPNGGNVNGSTVSSVQGQNTGSGATHATANAANTVNASAGTGVSGGTSASAIGTADAAASNAVDGGAGARVSGGALAGVGTAGAAASNTVDGSAGAGVSGGALAGVGNSTGSAATNVTGAASPADVSGARAIASNAIEQSAGSSAPRTNGNTLAVAHAAATVPTQAAAAGSGAPAATTTATAPAAASVNYEIRSTIPDLRIPGNLLYQTRPEPGARYLVETDPRYADYRTWLSSDFMLAQLNLDPGATLKRLGDGFYEQKLVIDQIMFATGQRHTGDYRDNEAQYQALMAAGVAFAQTYQLTPGIALTEEQMRQLTGDLVWLVEQDVTLADGSVQRVLAPQVYLRVKEGDIRGDGTLIAAREVKLNLAGDLQNNALIASRNLLQVNADNIRNRDGGRLQAATVDLAARTDIDNLSGKIAGNTVSLDAGRDIAIRTNTIDTAGVNTRRTGLAQIAGVTGEHIAMTAGRDLTIAGAKVDASGDVLLTAGRNLGIDAVETSRALDIAVSGHIRETEVRHAGSSVTAGGNLVIASGLTQDGDLTVRGSRLNAGGNLTAAGANIVVQNALDSRDVAMLTRLKNATDTLVTHRESAVVGRLDAGGNLTVVARGTLGADGAAQAGTGDLTLKGAQLASASGAIILAANHNVNLLEQQLTQSRHDESVYRGGTLVSKKSSNGMNDVQSTQSIGATVSGDRIRIGAGNDITARGATVVSSGDLALVAKSDIMIGASQDTRAETHTYQEKTSGLFSSGGASITLGKQQIEQNRDGQSVTNVGSQLASLEGNIVIDAGKQYAQSGSQVLALKGDIDIAARRVDINAALDSSASRQQDKSKSSGLTLAVSSPILSAVQTVDKMADAAKNTDDPRMKALAAATAALAVKNAYDAVTDPAAAASVTFSLTLGSSKSESSQVQSGTTAVGSTVAAGNTLSIHAKGVGQDSDINVTGSAIKAGNDAALQADGDLLLQAAQSTSELQRDSKSSSAGVGVYVSVGANTGFGLTANASTAKGNADGSDVIHSNTHVAAGNTLTLLSGSDTTLKGAVASGEQVIAHVGTGGSGKLSVESLQDTSDFHSKDKSAGGSLSVGFSTMAVSGSVNIGKSNIDSSYASVVEQSGIQAGDGGFQVKVAGNTDLKGGVIASSDKAVEDGKNSLVTQTLTTSDIENHADASAKSSGIGLSSDMLTQGKYGVAKGVIGNLLNNGSESGSSTGATLSAVSAGEIAITDAAGQKVLTGKSGEETVASLNRDTANANTVAGRQDVEAMKQSAEAAQAIKQEAFKVVTVYTDDAYKTLFVNKPNFYKVTCGGEMSECLNDPSKIKFEPITQDEAIKDGKVLAVNGILNDATRASQLAYQNASVDDQNNKPTEITLMHITPSQSSFSEVLVAGYEKTHAGPFFGYSNADQTYAGTLQGRSGEVTVSMGHSRGTIVQTNAFNILADKGYTNEYLKVEGVGGGVLASTYMDAAAKITGSDGKSNITYTYMANDPIPVIAAGNQGDALAALKEFINVWKYSNSAHSCYGTGAAGCATIASPIPGGPVPTNQNSNNVVTYRGGVLVSPEGNK